MQTERGTPLTGVPDARGGEAPPEAPVATSGRLVPFLLIVAAAVVLLDQVAKAIVVVKLTDHPPVELLGGVLTLRLLRNGGAAFGLATGFTLLFTLFAVIVIVVVVRLARRLRSRVWAVALGMLLGGSFGNLLDRIFRAPSVFRGHVVDFLELPHWPVFNLADSSIVCSGVLMVLLTYRGITFDGSPPPTR